MSWYNLKKITLSGMDVMLKLIKEGLRMSCACFSMSNIRNAIIEKIEHYPIARNMEATKDCL